ncbi:hypothetical protein Pcinc_017116 [Petrolisthes cinctipes]|uniref:Integrase catalytic domain-containing protein n=1 Tax=Petrolisthes cinctipes TaxID=88211 RepID=A0AAE1KNV1_PETCI|nr:hypothetical protein Pcinc_017116 [Petrolisthes cinctipes]
MALISNNSMEEYILTCRKRFAEDDVLHERVIFYQQTKQHVDGIRNVERKRIWRRSSSSFEWNEADKTLYFIQAAASRRKGDGGGNVGEGGGGVGVGKGDGGVSDGEGGGGVSVGKGGGGVGVGKGDGGVSDGEGGGGVSVGKGGGGVGVGKGGGGVSVGKGGGGGNVGKGGGGVSVGKGGGGVSVGKGGGGVSVGKGGGGGSDGEGGGGVGVGKGGGGVSVGKGGGGVSVGKGGGGVSVGKGGGGVGVGKGDGGVSVGSKGDGGVGVGKGGGGGSVGKGGGGVSVGKGGGGGSDGEGGGGWSDGRGEGHVEQVKDELCKAYGIKRSVTSAYHPQTNGLAERTNRTLKTRLAKLCNTKMSDWPDYLEEVAYSMHTQKQKSTGFTPYHLMFGRQHRPIDQFLEGLVSLPTAIEVSLFVQHQHQKRQEVHIKHEEKVNAAQEKQTADYNRRKKKGSKIYDLSVGIHVLQSNLGNESRKGGKMEPKWTGPYKILDIDCNQRVALETVKNGKKLNRRVSYNQLHPYLHSQLHDARSAAGLEHQVVSTDTENLVTVQQRDVHLAPGHGDPCVAAREISIEGVVE